MTQADKILDYIDRNGFITDAQAASEFDCYRLGARIYDLRKRGVPIITEKARSKKGRVYARYRRG